MQEPIYVITEAQRYVNVPRSTRDPFWASSLSARNSDVSTTDDNIQLVINYTIETETKAGMGIPLPANGYDQ